MKDKGRIFKWRKAKLEKLKVKMRGLEMILPNYKLLFKSRNNKWNPKRRSCNNVN